MYGKNAVGKTSLGYTILDIRSTILPNENQAKNTIGFLNANSTKDVAYFAYVFELNGIKIDYIYEKYDSYQLKYECLKIDGALLYEYHFETQQGDFSYLKKYNDVAHLNFDEWNGEISVLRYILTNSKLVDLSILKALRQFVEGIAILKPSEDIVKFSGPKILKSRIIPSIIEEGLTS